MLQHNINCINNGKMEVIGVVRENGDIQGTTPEWDAMIRKTLARHNWPASGQPLEEVLSGDYYYASLPYEPA